MNAGEASPAAPDDAAGALNALPLAAVVPMTCGGQDCTDEDLTPVQPVVPQEAVCVPDEAHMDPVGQNAPPERKLDGPEPTLVVEVVQPDAVWLEPAGQTVETA